MKKIYIYSSITVVITLLGICIFIYVGRSSGTKDNNTANQDFQEQFGNFVEHMELEESTTEAEDVVSESETEQKPYVHDIAEEYIKHSYETGMFINDAEEFVIHEYTFKGELPQTEITEMEDFDYIRMRWALCAIEDFCGLEFTVTDTYYIGLGSCVQFEHDGQQYTCVSDGITGNMKICDKVFEH